MYQIGERHPVEPNPERGRTENVLLDSDIDIRTNLLAQPTPPPSGHGLVSRSASAELAGAQQLSFRNDERLYGDPTPNPLTMTAGGDHVINAGKLGADFINEAQSDLVIECYLGRLTCGY